MAISTTGRIIIIFTLFILILSLSQINEFNLIGPDENEIIYPFENEVTKQPPKSDTSPTFVHGSRSRYLEDSTYLDDPAVQLTVISGDAFDNVYGNVGGGAPIATGDIDSDGIEDLILGCPFADGKAENLASAGQVMVIYGRNQTHPNTIFDQAAEDPEEINLVIHGGRGGSYMGFSLACGDIDGDNYDDLIMGAPLADGRNNRRVNSGEVYVIFGGTRESLGSEIDLQTVAPDLIIYGANGGNWPNQDYTGYSVALGDVIGDNHQDIIIGAVYANLPGKNNVGCIYVIAGKARSSLGTEIDLRAGGDVKINGVNADDYAGIKVSSGDTNLDSRDDIIIGAYGADPLGRTNAGAAYIIYGSQSLRTNIDLNDSADVSIYGTNANDYFGYCLAVGNINGDQIDDIVIGALYGDGPNNALGNCGEVYLIYGSQTLASIIDTNANDHDVVIYGKETWDLFGYSVAIGNVNNDRYDDILIGAILGDGDQNEKNNCGDTYLILGNSTGALGNNIDPLTDSRSIFYGVDNDDYSGRYVQFGDFDGDGFDDLCIFAPYADGINNGRDYAGEFYVIYGSPPPINIEFLKLFDGDLDNSTVLSRYREYTFKINASNILGYHDFNSVTLTLDTDGYNIIHRWSKLTNKFTRIRDPLALVDCTSKSSDAHNDGKYNYSLDFKFIFNWNFSSDSPISCKVSTIGQRSLLDEDVYPDIFKVNNQLSFKGELAVDGALQGVLHENDWVKGGEKLTFSGLVIVYNGTTEYYPPISDFSLGIEDNSELIPIANPYIGEPVTATIQAPIVTMDINYQLKILDLPVGCDCSSVSFTLKIDATPPDPPGFLICKADSFNDLEVVEVDDDQDIYIQWGDAMDFGSGTAKYYYSFENLSGTAGGFSTEGTSGHLSNTTEGLNTVYVWAEDKVGNIGLAKSKDIFIDLTEISFKNFQPIEDRWYITNKINCSIQVQDTGGFGVDPETLKYWDVKTQIWQPAASTQNISDPTVRDITVQAEILEGTESYIVFIASDLAGNGPTVSDKYYFKIDTIPITFTNASPDPKIKLASATVRCSITIEDLGGSGVDLATIQYSYSINGLANFTDWTDLNLAMIAKTDAEASSTWFINLEFKRGAENYIRWHAKDLAGNGYTLSENYSILINALPIIIVDELDPDITYKTTTDIEFNAERTYDIDNNQSDLVFKWDSNISGHLGYGEILNPSLPAGYHKITLTVFDGLNNASYSFEISISEPQPSEESTGMFNLGTEADLPIIGFIILIIILVLMFLAIFYRENKRRRALEKRVLTTGISYIPSRSSQVRAFGGISPSAQLQGPQGKGTQVIDAKPFPITQPQVGATTQVQQLPTVTVSSTAPRVSGAACAPAPLPQLPPAQISAQSTASVFTPGEEDIEPKKKLELLDKKMLLGEISIELYNKLSKRYEEQLNKTSKLESQTNTSSIHLPSPTTSQKTSTISPKQPTLGNMQDDLEHKTIPSLEPLDDGPTLGFTPDDPKFQKKIKEYNK